MDTIAQISTPLGNGGIAIVRVSGEKAIDIAFNLFYAKNLTKQNIEPRKLYLGKFNIFNGAKERCMMVYFKAPYSFTGEDVVEFQVHGGEYLATCILDTLLQNGCTLAQNGEFSRRAFVNGKMTLDEAEAMIDMINATSDAELKASSNLTNGDLYKQITKIQNNLKDCIANLEVSLDYPEHDDEEMSIQSVKQVLLDSKQTLSNLKQSFLAGKKIKFGFTVAIVGKPNVGKSSLLNRLVGEERAIVTDIKGTTRDTLKETIVYNGLKINFVDTAGMRESQDVVEKIGIERSRQAIDNSDIVLAIFDASQKFDKEDNDMIDLLKDKNVIYVLNKTDKQIVENLDNAIQISALNNKNIDKILDEILKKTKLDKIDFSQIYITNKRHEEIICNSIELIDEAINSLNMSCDIVDMQTKKVWQELGKITGETATEDILNEIFSKFCLGK